MIVFAVEPLAKCWAEMIVLAEKHWQETEAYRHGQPFAPRFDRYNDYDKSGWYFEGTIRDDGVLVGYAGIYLTPSMHSQQVIATEDSLFILPSHRKGRNAIRFIKFLEEECKRRGAVEVNITAKNPSVAKILAYLGYPQVATHHAKQLTP